MDIPKELVQDIAGKIVTIKREMEELEIREAPKDYTKSQIINWLDHIKEAPNETVARLLISKVIANKKEVSIESTLTPQLIGGDTPIHANWGLFPSILFGYR